MNLTTFNHAAAQILNKRRSLTGACGAVGAIALIEACLPTTFEHCLGSLCIPKGRTIMVAQSHNFEYPVEFL